MRRDRLLKTIKHICATLIIGFALAPMGQADAGSAGLSTGGAAVTVKAAEKESSATTVKNGFVTKNGKTYYYKNGKKQKGLKTIKKKLYYFDDKGVMQTGWVKVNGKKYYFTKSGAAYKNVTKYIKNLCATFDKNGVYQPAQSYYYINGVRLHVQYKTDPKVSDEELLAAILYAEAGGETQKKLTAKVKGKNYKVYKGAMAVGYVILNRLESQKYGSSLKEVIYQTYQFEPARTGVLTRLLKHPEYVSTECKNAAKVLLYDYKNRKNSVSKFKRKNFTWTGFWALPYAKNHSNFFELYSKSEYKIIGNQVFFNYTKTITTY